MMQLPERSIFRGVTLSHPHQWVSGMLLYTDDNIVGIIPTYSGDFDKNSLDPSRLTCCIYPVDTATVGQLCCFGRDHQAIFEGDYVLTCTGRICEVTYLGSSGFQGFDLLAVENLHCPAPPPYLMWEGLEVVGNHWDGLDLMSTQK